MKSHNASELHRTTFHREVYGGGGGGGTYNFFFFNFYYVNSFLYSFHWVIPEKIHTHTTEGMLANLTGGGVNGSGNPDARGPLNLKIHPRG